jgi:hypothetical protein
MVYLLPENPASSVLSLPRLRSRARRAGYLVSRDRYTGDFSLIDARLRVPLRGLDHVGLGVIVRAVEAARTSA